MGTHRVKLLAAVDKLSTEIESRHRVVRLEECHVAASPTAELLTVRREANACTYQHGTLIWDVVLLQFGANVLHFFVVLLERVQLRVKLSVRIHGRGNE